CGIIEVLRLIERTNIDCRVWVAFLRQRLAERSGAKRHGQCRAQPPVSQSGFAITNVEAAHIILLRGKCPSRLSVRAFPVLSGMLYLFVFTPVLFRNRYRFRETYLDDGYTATERASVSGDTMR